MAASAEQAHVVEGVLSALDERDDVVDLPKPIGWTHERAADLPEDPLNPLQRVSSSLQRAIWRSDEERHLARPPGLSRIVANRVAANPRIACREPTPDLRHVLLDVPTASLAPTMRSIEHEGPVLRVVKQHLEPARAVVATPPGSALRERGLAARSTGALLRSRRGHLALDRILDPTCSAHCDVNFRNTADLARAPRVGPWHRKPHP